MLRNALPWLSAAIVLGVMLTVIGYGTTEVFGQSWWTGGISGAGVGLLVGAVLATMGLWLAREGPTVHTRETRD